MSADFFVHFSCSSACSWEDYSPVGRVIAEARVICFKTPLRAGFFAEEDARRFDVPQLLAAVAAAGGVLGLVVDLTFTRRYYDGAELEAAGVAYRKLMIPGRDNEELARKAVEFVDCLRDFFAQPENEGESPLHPSSSTPLVAGKWVGVHCTHGLNRTGYLVCRYLHEALGWPVEEAIRSECSHPFFLPTPRCRVRGGARPPDRPRGVRGHAQEPPALIRSFPR